MRIEYLYYYLDLVGTVSISKTASKFYMTPQGLSRAIHSLETEFGISLINRTSNAITISCAGQEFAVRAQAIIDSYEKAKQAMQGYAMRSVDFSDPDISIVATQFFFTYLYELISDQIQQDFSFSLKFSETNIYRLIPRVAKAQNTGTVGIISRPRLASYDEYVERALVDEKLCYEPLMSMRLQALVSASSPLVDRDEISLDDIRKYPIACYNDTVLIDTLSSVIGENSNITLITNSSHALNQHLTHNQAISFVPSIVAATGIPKNTVLKNFEGSYITEIGFVASPTNFLSIDVQNAIAYMRKFFEECLERTPFKGAYQIMEAPLEQC